MTAQPDRIPAPSVEPPAEFIGARGTGVTSASIDKEWWHLFEDTQLDTYVSTALAANTDLRVAVANLQVARASAQVAQATRWPATVIESGAGPDRADRLPSTSSVPKTSYEIGATLAFELDLFDRLRHAQRAAQADANAAEAARDSVRVAIISDTVSAYIDYCTAVATQALTNDQVAAQQRSVELVAHQLGEGEVSGLEHSQALATLERIRASLPTLDADRRRALFRLATLQGLSPATTESWQMTCSSIPRVNHSLPIGDGTALIARRPDVREAEHRLAAAVARIGIATADLYPRITLGGSAGQIGGGFDAFLTPLITWSFPNRSVVRARIAGASASEQAALANWDSIVLRALREVESTLADYQAEQLRSHSLSLALEESRKARSRAQARFRLGADSYLLVLDAERTVMDLTMQQAASDARVAQLVALLFRALGARG